MDLQKIAQRLLVMILDAVLPVLIETLIQSGASVEAYLQEKAAKVAAQLTPEEIKNEVNDLGKIIRKIF